MIRAVPALLLVLCLMTGIVHGQPVLVLNLTGKPPLNTPQADGFLDQVTALALQRIGYRLETIELPAERGLKSANSGLIDGEMSRIAGLERVYPNLLQVPEKIMDWEFMVFSRKPIQNYRDWHSLAGHYVAFINGWKIIENNMPGEAHVTRVRTAEQLFSLLHHKRIDHIIYERWSGLRYLENFGLDQVRLEQPPLAKREMFIYLHKKHRALVPRLARALKAIKKDGNYRKIWQRTLYRKTHAKDTPSR